MTDVKIKPGYKMTEIGVIPEDWEIKELGEIAEIATGMTPSTNDKTNYGSEYLFVSPIDLGKVKYVINTEKKLSQKGFNISRKYPKGSILYTCIGSTIGKTGIAPFSMTSNQQINAVFPNESYFNEFLYYLLIHFTPKIKSQAGEQAVPIINKTGFSETKLYLPKTLEEQKAIAQVLSDTDELIQSLDELIEKKEKIKEGTIQELLTGKRRLPGFSEEWEEKKLGEIGNFTGSGVDKLLNQNEIPVRLVNYMDVYKRDFIYGRELNHWVTATLEKYNKCKVQQGDIFFTPSSETRQDIGLSAVAMEDIHNAVYSYHITRFRIKEDWDLKFRSYAFKTKFFMDQAEQICEGSGKRYVVGLGKFKQLKIYYPTDINEQKAIADVLSDMDNEIENLKEKRDKYKQIKEGMMQEILTGKIRLV